MAIKHTDEMYVNHRERMREQAARCGVSVLEDVKLLEVCLYGILPRIDTYPIAYNLLKEFGTLDKVFSASAEELMKVDGIGQKVAFNIIVIGEIMSRTGERCFGSTALNSYEAVYSYVRWILRNEGIDTAAIIYLDEKGGLITCSKYPANYEASKRIRSDIKKTIEKNKVKKVVLAHKHPENVLEPSAEDITTTDRFYTMCRELGAKLEEHFILSGNELVPIIGRVTGEKSEFFRRAE